MTSAETVHDWLALADDSIPLDIGDLKILRDDGVSSVSLRSGNINAAKDPTTGIYFHDTRYLSRLDYSLGGVTPQLVDSSVLPFALTAIFSNPPLTLPSGS